MTRIKILSLVIFGGFLAACSNSNVVSRSAPFEPLSLEKSLTGTPEEGVFSTDTTFAQSLLNVQVEEISVLVPQTLKVSEANSYLPKGDIVWRGEPHGDRYAQVKAIFEAALLRGTEQIIGERPVHLEIEVQRFHGLSEKARYTVGGVHNITFLLTLRDPVTGVALAPPRQVQADLEAFGGKKAIKADSVGQTQKVRITDHLAHVIHQELTQVDGFQNPRLGLFQAMNKRL